MYKTMSEIKRGIYRHYKGGEYEVIEEAIDSESKEEVVVYKDIVSGKVWVRPTEMFLSDAETKEGKKPRFEFLREDEKEDSEQKYLRALADYQNLLRQTAKEKSDFAKFAISDFLQEIIPVYDHLKLSIKGLNEEEAKSAWVEGVKHVLKQFKSVLESRGVEEIKTGGEKFNHDEMEALEGDGDMVKSEVMSGYKLAGKVIRPARVTVWNKE